MPTFASATDIDELIATLPRDEQLLVRRLRGLITECLPKATEKAYKGQAMLFYTRHRLICFIWPRCIPALPRKR